MQTVDMHFFLVAVGFITVLSMRTYYETNNIIKECAIKNGD